MTDRFERPDTNSGDALSELRAEVKDLRRRCHDLSNGISAVNTEREKFETDIVGAKGDNGKIGSLRGSIHTLRSVLIAVSLAALGGLGTGIAAVYSAGEARGTERARLEALERQVGENTGTLKTLVIWSEVFRLRMDSDGGRQ